MNQATSTIENEPKILPGDLAIWFLIFAELLVFGVFFIVYSVQRLNHVEMFNQFQSTLNRDIGVVNTLLLITSSYFVVLAVRAIGQGNAKGCIHWLNYTLLLGSGFLVFKSIEFYGKFSHGIGLDTNTFYFFYLSLTMFHFIHVFIGMLIIAAVIFKAKRGKYTKAEHTGVETAASYWHMVDLVWLILFPLVYIIR